MAQQRCLAEKCSTTSSPLGFSRELLVERRAKGRYNANVESRIATIADERDISTKGAGIWWNRGQMAHPWRSPDRRE
jgi:hypothetical protein